MEFPYWYSLLISTSLLLSSLLLRARWHRSAARHNRPPGPTGYPIIGNMLDLGSLPHRTLYNLRSKYGPVMWLKLGSINTIAVQSARSASELLKNHDRAFCDRACPRAFTSHGYNLGSLTFSRYNAYWRVVRKLTATELLSAKRVSDTASLRQRCVDDALRSIAEDSYSGSTGSEPSAVEVVRHLFVMSFNIMGNLTVSKDLAGAGRGREFFDAMKKSLEWAGTPDVVEYLPWLEWFDPQGLTKKMDRDLGTVMRIIDGLVRERVEEKKKMEGEGEKVKVKNDFVDALLNYEGDGKEGSERLSTHKVIVSIILEMFFGGTETTSGTLEWAMAELLKSPNSMKKAKEELDRVVGPRGKVSETHMDHLPYLQAVIKEVMRLHPAVPLIPRNTLEDTKFMGYMIPKDTQVFINAWAVGRDPEAWDDPLSFKPERFVGSDIDFKGQNFELIPFGSGRRMCVGMNMAHKVVQLALASLLHAFDWELEAHVSPETLDMNDGLGITLRKYVPLRAIPKKRNVGI